MNQHNKPKADLLTDYVLDEVPVEQLLKELQNQTFEYNDDSLNSSDSGIALRYQPVQKTPISKLQELLAKRGAMLPEYNENIFEILRSGFRFGCTVRVIDRGEPKSCQGLANNKKDAKHAAAKQMYELMTGKILPGPTALSAPSPTIQESDPPIIQQPPPPANISYINKLQEVSVKYGHACPTYPNERRTGPPHLPQFEVDCVWRNERTTGTATTKKLAKTHSAHLMFTKFFLEK